MEAAPPKKAPLIFRTDGIWYRYRYFVYALITSNVLMVSYSIFHRDKFFRGPIKVDKDDAKDAKEAKPEDKKAVFVPATQPKSTVAAAEEKSADVAVIAKSIPAAQKKPQGQHVSHNEQMELYRWMLDEKRKAKPSSSEEKARIDMEKGVLKDYIRGKLPSL